MTPRRLALVVDGLPAHSADERKEEKGPKVGAPQPAIDGFLKKHGLASLAQCEQRDAGKDREQGDPQARADGRHVAARRDHELGTLRIVSQFEPVGIVAYAVDHAIAAAHDMGERSYPRTNHGHPGVYMKPSPATTRLHEARAQFLEHSDVEAGLAALPATRQDAERWVPALRTHEFNLASVSDAV